MCVHTMLWVHNQLVKLLAEVRTFKTEILYRFLSIANTTNKVDNLLRIAGYLYVNISQQYHHLQYKIIQTQRSLANHSQTQPL